MKRSYEYAQQINRFADIYRNLHRRLIEMIYLDGYVAYHSC